MAEVSSQELNWAKRFRDQMRRLNDVIATIKSQADLKLALPKLARIGESLRKLQHEGERMKVGRSREELRKISEKIVPVLNAEQVRTSKIMSSLRQSNSDLFEKVRDVLSKMAKPRQKAQPSTQTFDPKNGLEVGELEVDVEALKKLIEKIEEELQRSALRESQSCKERSPSFPAVHQRIPKRVTNGCLKSLPPKPVNITTWYPGGESRQKWGV